MSSSSGSGEGKWTGRLHFLDPEEGKLQFQHPDHIYKYFREELNAEEEIIIFAEIRKYNLYGSILGTILGWFGVWHEYTIVETTNWWWSFEKYDKGLFAQRSKKKEKVQCYCGVEKRKPDRTEGRSSKVSFGENVIDIVNWIINRRALDKTYHVTESNCHFFASLLYEAITKTKGRSLDNTK